MTRYDRKLEPWELPVFDHSDNTGQVGWTCVHGYITHHNARVLKLICPHDSWLTATFYDERRHDRSSITPELMEGYYGDKRCGYYFTFPLDRNGVDLLRMLGFEPTTCRFWPEAKRRWHREVA